MSAYPPAKNGQSPVYATGSFYRDHLYHVVDVCLLGELLLRSIQPGGDSDAEYRTLAESVVQCTKISPPEQLLQNWYVAALCHDLGYIVEQAGELLKPVGEFSGDGLDDFAQETGKGLEEGKQAIRQAIQRTVESTSVASINLPVEEIKRKPTDHGVVAWLHLNHWIKQVRKSPELLADALQAILRHNLSDQEVNIYQEPLTLLLMLCDHLQEWGRPRVGPDPLARGIMEALRFSEQPEFKQKICVHQLLVRGLRPIRVEFQDVPPYACDSTTISDSIKQRFRVHTRIEKSGLEFELPYVESRGGDFEPAISWLLLCRDLQCLGSQKEKLPYPICITLQHAPPRIWSVLRWRPLEMDLLQDFANSYRPAAYLCEWIEFARRGEKGIEYRGDRETGKETFTIRLRELDHPLQRGLSDEHWKSFRKWKWQRLGQQFLVLSLGTWFPTEL